MSYKFTEECINCGACEPECLNQAITEGEIICTVDPAKCTECVGQFATPKCIEVCPVPECIILDPDHVETKKQLLAKWRKLHPGETPVEGTY